MKRAILKEQYISYLPLLQTFNNISAIILLHTFNIISFLPSMCKGNYIIADNKAHMQADLSLCWEHISFCSVFFSVFRIMLFQQLTGTFPIKKIVVTKD